MNALEEALRLYQDTNIPVDEICRIRKMAKSTFYRKKPQNIVRGHANKGRIYTFNFDKFKEESREKYYWLGFLGADGTIVNNTLSIELNSIDKNHLIKFNNWCENTAKITERVNNMGSKCSKTTLNSIELVNYLKKYGLTQNKSKSFEMVGIPDIYSLDFIRGYIDGDGTVAMKGSQIYLSVVSGNRKMIEQIEEILQTGNKISDCGTYFKIACLGNNKAKEILDRIYENSTEETRLDRKYETYMALASCGSDSQDKLCELLKTP